LKTWIAVYAIATLMAYGWADNNFEVKYFDCPPDNPKYSEDDRCYWPEERRNSIAAFTFLWPVVVTLKFSSYVMSDKW